MVGGVFECLAGEFIELGLGIEALHVACPAEHEKPDDALGLGREVGTAVGGVRADDAFGVEQGAKRESGESHARVRQELAAVLRGATGVVQGFGLHAVCDGSTRL